jgi:hypothetical protein
MHVLCSGVPAVLVFFLGGRIIPVFFGSFMGERILWDIALWVALSFVFSMLYSAVTTIPHLPKLELVHEKEEFQSLNLSK